MFCNDFLDFEESAKEFTNTWDGCGGDETGDLADRADKAADDSKLSRSSGSDL